MATELNIEQGLFNFDMAFMAWAQEVYDRGQVGAQSVYTQLIEGDGSPSISLQFLTNSPKMRKWQGARQYKGLRHYSMTVTYDDWEATLPLKTRLVDYDPKGIVNSMLPVFKSQVDAYDSAVSAQFFTGSGAGPTGFDAVALYSASHPHANGGGTQSNLGSGTNLSHAALRSAEAAALAWTQENGALVYCNFTDMVVGPNLKRRAMELLEANRQIPIDAGGDEAAASVIATTTIPNVFQGEYRLTVDPRHTTNYYWTLVDTTKGPIRPMVLFVVQAPTPIDRVDPSDPHRFEFREYIYGVEARFGVAAGHWYTTYRGTGTA